MPECNISHLNERTLSEIILIYQSDNLNSSLFSYYVNFDLFSSIWASKHCFVFATISHQINYLSKLQSFMFALFNKKKYKIHIGKINNEYIMNTYFIKRAQIQTLTDLFAHHTVSSCASCVLFRRDSTRTLANSRNSAIKTHAHMYN